jgi:hypothetical protein
MTSIHLNKMVWFQGLCATDSKTDTEAELEIQQKSVAEGNIASVDSGANPPDKRQRLYPASVDVTMEEFFYISHLRADDDHTLSVMDDNHFYHWSSFKGMSEADLVNVGFCRGAASD